MFGFDLKCVVFYHVCGDVLQFRSLTPGEPTNPS